MVNIICGILLASQIALAQEPPPSPLQKIKVESVQGAKTVTVTVPVSGYQTEKKEVTSGTQLEAGSRVQVHAKSKVVLTYESGESLELSDGADFEPEGVTQGVSVNELHSGRVRGTVPSVKQKGPKSGDKKVIRFLIRSKSVVMGVRGTLFDMTFESATKNARVETIQGSVEVAKDQATLLTQGGLEIPAGQFITATPSGLSALQSAAAAATSAGQAPPPPTPAAAPLAALPLFGIAGLREWLPTPHIFYFELGALVSEDPRLVIAPIGGTTPSNQYKPSPFLSWKPGLGLPKVDFLRLRLHVGFAKRDHYLIRELGFFFTAQPLDFAFAEVGWGHESWLTQTVEGSTFTINAGLITASSGFPDRIIVGRTTFNNPQRSVDQWRIGLGFSF